MGLDVVDTWDEQQKERIEEIRRNIINSYPSRHGLNIAEIMMLYYARTFETTQTEFQGFWYYRYAIENPARVLKSLYERGFVCIASAENSLKNYKVTELKEILKELDLKLSGKKSDLIQRIIDNTDSAYLNSKIDRRNYDLTDLGRQELAENEYVTYFHNSKQRMYDIDVFWVNKKLHLNPSANFLDLILEELNVQAQKAIKKTENGSYKSYVWNRLMIHDFLIEGKKNYEQALYFFAEAVYYDIHIAASTEYKRALQDYEQQIKWSQSGSLSYTPNKPQFTNYVTISIHGLDTIVKELNLSDDILLQKLVSIFQQFNSEEKILSDTELANFVILMLKRDRESQNVVYSQIENKISLKNHSKTNFVSTTMRETAVETVPAVGNNPYSETSNRENSQISETVEAFETPEPDTIDIHNLKPKETMLFTLLSIPAVLGAIIALIELVSENGETAFNMLLSAFVISPFTYTFIYNFEAKRNKKTSVFHKIGIQIVVSIIIFIFAIFSSGNNNASDRQIAENPPSEQIVETTQEVTEPITETKLETIPDTTEESTETAIESEPENEKSIADTEIEPDKKAPHSDVIKKISKDNFEIYNIYSKPSNPNISVPSVSLDSALKKASNNFPYDEVKIYYSFSTSYCFQSETRGNVYFIIYSLNDNGKLYNEEHFNTHLSSQIYTVIKTSSTGDVEEAYFKGEPEKWMNFPEKNGYVKTDWYYNFMDDYIETEEIETTEKQTEPEPETLPPTEVIPKPVQEPEPVAPQPPQPQQILFILNTDTNCVHLKDTCSAAQKILPENYTTIYIWEDEIPNYAYTYWACGICAKKYSDILPNFN